MERSSSSWQLILADISLILFLVTAAAYTAESAPLDAGPEPAAQPASKSARKANPVAQAQSLYRPGEGLPSLVQWLESQPRDPRASLTIIAEHRQGDEARVWGVAQRMAQSVAGMNVRVRVIIRKGEASDVYASLAYDQP